MKPLKNTSLLLLSLLVLGTTIFTSCKRDDDPPEPPANTATFGKDTIDLTQGFKFDKSHSSVLWECPYVGAAGLLTGRFNSFGLNDFYFIENQPSKIKFTGWVQLNTVNTGEPGRDAGCLLGTFGVEGTPDSIANTALLIAKKVEFSGKSKEYNVTCDLIFHGATSEVKAKMVFTGITHFDAGQVSSKAMDVGGLTLTFPFNAKTDHGIVSTNIPDVVDVKVNATFKRTF